MKPRLTLTTMAMRIAFEYDCYCLIKFIVISIIVMVLIIVMLIIISSSSSSSSLIIFIHIVISFAADTKATAIRMVSSLRRTQFPLQGKSGRSETQHAPLADLVRSKNWNPPPRTCTYVRIYIYIYMYIYIYICMPYAICHMPYAMFIIKWL